MRAFLTGQDRVVPTHHPRVIVEVAAARGADPEELLARTGLTAAQLADPDTRLTIDELEALERGALALTGDPALGLEVARRVRLPMTGMLGVAAQNAPDLRAALDLVARYLRWLAPAWALEVGEAADEVTLTFRETLPRGDLIVFATEALAFGLQTLAAEFLGARLPVRAAQFAYPAPPHAARYAEFVDGRVTFGADVTVAHLDARHLARAIPGADPAMAKLSERYCAEQAAGTLAAGGLLEQVRAALRAPDRPPDPARLARQLRTSPRTLRRELARAGSSYQALADELRRERALSWVRTTNLTIAQISERLGFSDVRAFRRAFGRWTGQTPADYRAAAGSGS